MNTALRILAVLSILMLLVFALSSCGDGSAPVAPTVDHIDADKAAWLPGLENESFILQCYAAANDYVYETVLEMEIDVADGGTVSGYPPSWGPQYPFSITVPAGSIDPATAGGPTVTISLKVPVFDTAFFSPDAPLPLEFAPDGLVFDGGLQLTASMHPTLESGTDQYTLYYVDPDGNWPLVTSYDADRIVTRSLDEPGRNIAALIEHFSRWDLDADEDTTTTP